MHIHHIKCLELCQTRDNVCYKQGPHEMESMYVITKIILENLSKLLKRCVKQMIYVLRSN